MEKRETRRREVERMLVDGASEERSGTVRPLVRDGLFMGWGPKLV